MPRSEHASIAQPPDPERRRRMIAAALALLERRAAADPTISGATMILPSGEVLYLGRELVGRGAGGRA